MNYNQCYELLGVIALKNHAFSFKVRYLLGGQLNFCRFSLFWNLLPFLIYGMYFFILLNIGRKL